MTLRLPKPQAKQNATVERKLWLLHLHASRNIARRERPGTRRIFSGSRSRHERAFTGWTPSNSLKEHSQALRYKRIRALK
ncbi:hypothetical protein KPH14_010717 [Odynerus spinipes]|uniref:Uncharacterized protein n=1 Tax=Odynerus spinipes TaxID=1348599 RepID=A0AAD9RUY5_9HYME|nr:hypothetical protein KPH14_010717 [Odynerus spinipes]